MNVSTNAQQIITQIRENPLSPITEFGNKIDKDNFIETSAWILQNYGGTTCHKFLIKFNEPFIKLNLNELKECVQLIDNDVLGLDVLTAFYFFFTDITEADFFDELNIPQKIYGKYIGNNYHDNPFNKKLLISFGLEPDTIFSLQNMWKKQAA